MQKRLTLGLVGQKPQIIIMADSLKVPAQLETQLAKCKTVRDLKFYKPRTKSEAVSYGVAIVSRQSSLSLLGCPV